MALREIEFSYGADLVLRSVDLCLERGMVHGLVGHNGSGKSTLLNVLSGVVSPQSGTVEMDGRQVRFSRPADAHAAGVAMVHQDDRLFPDLPVSICVHGLARPFPRRHGSRRIDHPAIEESAREVLLRLGSRLEPRALIRSLSVADRKVVAIAHAMADEPSVLLLDEPTAAFGRDAALSLHGLVERLRDHGVAVCFVSHRLDEVVKLSDEISVMRDGRVVGGLDRSTSSEEAITSLMLGQESDTVVPATKDGGPGEDVRLALHDVRLTEPGRPWSIEVRRGEVLGLAGVSGSGAATTVRMIGGAESMRGTFSIDGDRVTISSPREALAAGIGLISADRPGEGVLTGQSVALNIGISDLQSISDRGFMSAGRLRRSAERWVENLGIVLRTPDQPIGSLSGGNQQKTLIARLLASGCRILAIEEPTQGVDVGAQRQIHRFLRDFAADGGTVVLTATESRELLSVCDRVLIFHHGEPVAERSAAELAARAGAATADELAALVELENLEEAV